MAEKMLWHHACHHAGRVARRGQLQNGTEDIALRSYLQKGGKWKDSRPAPLQLHDLTPKAPPAPPVAGHAAKKNTPFHNPLLGPTIISQNVCGAKGDFDPYGTRHDLNKIENIFQIMKEQEIDIYLLQEMWLLGDWNMQVHGVQVLHHGPSEPASRHGSGGVVSLLSP